MSKLDRTLQRALLDHLASVYPNAQSTAEFVGRSGVKADGNSILANIAYLGEHELIRGLEDAGGDPRRVLLHGPYWKITAKGLDFLEDDGGLSAILNVTTVRLEADTLKALIAAQVDTIHATPEEKSRLKEAIKDISTDTLKDVVKSLVQQGISKAPEAYELLCRLLRIGD